MDFKNYTLPDIDFGFADVYQFPVPQQQYNLANMPVAQVIPRTTAPVIRKTISFTVADTIETLPGANISVDGIAIAQTDGNGRVTLPNIATTSIIKVSYIGYSDFSVVAALIPSKVVLQASAEELQEVIIYTKPKAQAQSSSTIWWWVAGAAAVGAIIYTKAKTGAKIVKAKI